MSSMSSVLEREYAAEDFGPMWRVVQLDALAADGVQIQGRFAYDTAAPDAAAHREFLVRLKTEALERYAARTPYERMLTEAYEEHLQRGYGIPAGALP